MQDYIASLRKMCRFCNFADLERTLRDRLVCGVNDVKLQENLLKKANLTYSTAVQLAFQAEKCMEDLKALKVPDIGGSSSFNPASDSRGSEEVEPMEVNAVGDDKKKKSYCYRCGGSHMYHKCKFVSAKCNACSKIGHIAKICRRNNISTGNVKEIQEREEDFMNILYCVGGTYCYLQILIGQGRVNLLGRNWFKPLRISVQETPSAVQYTAKDIAEQTGTRFDIIHPFSTKPVAERQIERNTEVPVRVFRLKDKVWLRNYARGEKWVKGEIFRIKGPVRFLVKMEDGPIVTRHVNQLRRRDSDEVPGPSNESRDILGIPSHATVTCEGDMLQRN
ncbi:polyprotein [Operophtera brumata]|uniref:Polyprotein n=1 Tax=Operophtera brumata TaxID=104452 RepID=A0A0L7KWC1_OPEBR|nr:polyprotein [Operophtera brumata]